MRKADYATLAAIIRAQLRMKEDSASRLNDPGAQCAVRTLEHVAREFVNRSSVNKEEFLKACGIEP